MEKKVFQGLNEKLVSEGTTLDEVYETDPTDDVVLVKDVAEGRVVVIVTGEIHQDNWDFPVGSDVEVKLYQKATPADCDKVSKIHKSSFFHEVTEKTTLWLDTNQPATASMQEFREAMIKIHGEPSYYNGRLDEIDVNKGRLV